MSGTARDAQPGQASFVPGRAACVRGKTPCSCRRTAYIGVIEKKPWSWKLHSVSAWTAVQSNMILCCMVRP